MTVQLWFVQFETFRILRILIHSYYSLYTIENIYQSRSNRTQWSPQNQTKPPISFCVSLMSHAEGDNYMRSLNLNPPASVSAFEFSLKSVVRFVRFAWLTIKS